MKADTYKTLEEYQNALIEKARNDAQESWKQIEKKQRLLNLHNDLGYASTKALIAALQDAAGIKARKVKATGEVAKTTGKKAPKAKKEKTAGKRKRAKITPEIIAQAKEMKAAGKGPSEISRTLGISVPSYYNIIKA